MSIIIGIDHGYYAIKTAHCSFPAGLTSYGEHEPYTRQGLLEFGGCFFVCGSGRQPIQRDKTVNDNYYLLTLAAIAREILQRGLPPECSVRIAAGLPLTSFGRDKPKFKDYLLRSNQPVNFKFEGVEYSITIEEVAVFPQGYDLQGGTTELEKLQQKLADSQQEFDRLLDMSLECDASFLDEKLKHASEEIDNLQKQVDQLTASQQKAANPNLQLTDSDFRITEYSDTLVARIIERIEVISAVRIKIEFIGGYTVTVPLQS